MIMVTASFSGILRTIVIMILVFYAIKFLLRIFAPVIIQQVVKKAGQSMYEQQQQQQQQQQYSQAKNQPDATVAGRPREKKKVGEYIDYEEIK
jgi:competence protein ComGC